MARAAGRLGAADGRDAPRRADEPHRPRARDSRAGGPGLSNDEIAEELFISPATVKTHLARVMAKTDAHDRAQLVVFA